MHNMQPLDPRARNASKDANTLKECEVAQPTMPVVGSAWSTCDARQREQALGICFVITVAVIWVAASFLVQNLEQQGINPFLLTYIANSLFIVLIPVSIASSTGGSEPQPRLLNNMTSVVAISTPFVSSLPPVDSLQHCQKGSCTLQGCDTAVRS